MLAALLWAAIGGGGIALLNLYAGTAGEQHAAPPAWPTESRLDRSRELPTLLVFLHPQCPCSQATLEQVARLLARHGRQVSTQCVFVRPDGMSPELLRGALWEQALDLPEVGIVTDELGREAELFGAATSGVALLYSAAGRLLFAGGVTPARGHAGDNPGQDAIAAWLEGRAPRTSTAPVFGCALLAPEISPEASCCDD